MGAETFWNLLSELQAIDAPEEAKRTFGEMIRKAALAEGLASFEREERHRQRVEFARHLMRDLEVSRPVVRDRLMGSYQVSRAQAYADIAEALNCPENPIGNWTNEANNEPHGKGF